MPARRRPVAASVMAPVAVHRAVPSRRASAVAVVAAVRAAAAAPADPFADR
jgi:hypothetical protein